MVESIPLAKCLSCALHCDIVGWLEELQYKVPKRKKLVCVILLSQNSYG